jgi:YD repeat-containing protein
MQKQVECELLSSNLERTVRASRCRSLSIWLNSQAQGGYRGSCLDVLKIKEEWYTGTTLSNTLNFEYDALGTLLKASDSVSSVDWQYDGELLRQESQTLASNITAQFNHQYKDDMLQLLTTSVGGVTDSTTTFARAIDGQITQIQQTGTNVSDKSVQYTYDNAGKRTRVERVTGRIVVAFLAELRL